MQHEHKFYDRAEASRRWFTEEFTPVVRILHAADLIGDGTDAEAYLTIARERYRLIRTHEWNDEVIEELQRQFRAPRWHIRSPIAALHPQEKNSGVAADEQGAAADEHGTAADEHGTAAADEQSAAADEHSGRAAEEDGDAAAD
jgi:hypothetical protein